MPPWLRAIGAPDDSTAAEASMTRFSRAVPALARTAALAAALAAGAALSGCATAAS